MLLNDRINKIKKKNMRMTYMSNLGYYSFIYNEIYNKEYHFLHVVYVFNINS